MNIKYYNDEFKMELISSLNSTSTVNIYKSLFKKTKFIEEKYQKDIYEFKPQEMNEILGISELVATKSTFNNVKRLLAEYFYYASSHGRKINQHTVVMVENLNYDELDISHLLRIKFFRNYISMAKVFDDIMKCANEQDTNEDNFIIERMCCIAGLVWYDVAPEDITELTEQDIDKNKNTIYLMSCNRRMALPDILIDQCLALSQYECLKRPTGVGMGTFYFADNDKIIKIKKVNRECEAYDMLQNIRQNFLPVFEQRLKTLPEELREAYKDYTFQYKDIARNGRFERFHNKEEQEHHFNYSFEDYREVFDLPRSTAFNEFKTYQQWKKVYDFD